MLYLAYMLLNTCIASIKIISMMLFGGRGIVGPGPAFWLNKPKSDQIVALELVHLKRATWCYKAPAMRRVQESLHAVKLVQLSI